MTCLGLDIGGANVKAADANGRAYCRSFAVWKSPERLADVLAEVVSQFSAVDVVAVTMTAELADCFATKAEGVDVILAAVEAVAGRAAIGVWQTGAEFVTPELAREIPLLVSAANWHALATFVGRLAPHGQALLIDIGTTTTDIIPLQDGVPVPQGLTDVERLVSAELVYSGVRRTPLCAIAQAVPFREGYCPLAAEFFATTLDVYLILGIFPADPNDCETANGRPATATCALDRLARAFCCDRTQFNDEDGQTIARFLADVQQQRLLGAMSRVLQRFPGECRSVLLSGVGSFVADELVLLHARTRRADVIRLRDAFTPQVSEAACAYAVARLAAERL